MVLGFDEVDRSAGAVAGGKGANLGELARITGVRVPPGVVVPVQDYRRFVDAVPGFAALVEGLPGSAAALRAAIEGTPVPADLAAEITGALGTGGYAVRSSATAEDLPDASFAGQQDTFLDVPPGEVVERVRTCWASLFTDRAVAYRAERGIHEGRVAMAVVVQEMVAAEVSGVLFTADPLTSNRTVTRIEAVHGLGEALVSGRVDPDVYAVRAGAVSGSGDTLSEAQVRELEELGRRIEAHFGSPQDIEWCLAGDGAFSVVQSRPITTLFPVPPNDGGPHVYLSVGHQQMMTDAMTPLGLSVWQRTTPMPMAEAGSRLFADATPRLRSPALRRAFLSVMGTSDPLMRDALETVLDRGFIPLDEEDGAAVPPVLGGGPPPIAADPALVQELIAGTRASLAATAKGLAGLTGTALVEFVEADFAELRRVLHDPRSARAFLSGMDAATWLDEHMREWLGETGAADVLTRSAPHNVTSEMGLALLDVADAVRPFPQIVEFLRTAREDFLDRLPALEGGATARRAIEDYLDAYGARCVGEIDIARPRWREQPTALLPLILGNVDTMAPGERGRRVEEGLAQARAMEEDLLTRLRALPDGEAKAARTAAAIARLRTFIGYREYPKFGMVSRYLLYKEALLAEADRQVAAGVLADRADLFLLRLDEFAEVVRTGRVSPALLEERRAAFRAHQALTPPRVLTSEGETLSGSYRGRDVPPGALVGLPVSAGTAEGRARVVLDLATADLEAGDVLVTAYTDPSWSPAFVTVAGLVTEVGGLMTHGAVVAREYGLPAVVGVEGATTRIPDGARIRVHGSAGYIEILDHGPSDRAY
ncbi:phosphoenolpyruvate synthase [Pseudonocardia sp. WMMC193]|uniref:phosphoenolpyruvate synthase n=1 Tax=Pseudonocardia sp. WMMC193 TaxID=2911965 RepID=UPI001F374499|nr:phosphoenolpyruvate synthase [Pseudonocardia sp. WMMC193]MCF7547411.1 phosphoenolpyruvate synthase [Pseudonocardia sp. WMMC193]MCF7553891.1 phosphoenolpyruvate synthase [Pseudonocardia sp. WMMC193]MCF7553920.1 phosphoenolpyruvate synthase [Pseudonocardia sp. WMMC193]MCF7553948.1 phosphoenolpyruvate synthase [Pseudonocardia sp. WMMC193]